MIDYQREFGVVCCTYQRVRVIFSKSHTSNIRSASFTKISTTNHCAYITQKILTQSFHTHYTSYITTEKNHRLLNRIHCFDIFYQFMHHDSPSPGATNTTKCETPFCFDEFFPILAYVRDYYVVHVHMGYRVNEIQGVIYS